MDFSAMDDDFTTVTDQGEAEIVDAAADFLAKEQEELGELGEELGLQQQQQNSNGDWITTSSPDFLEEVNNLSISASTEQADELSGPFTAAKPANYSLGRPKEEPETIRKWRENQMKLLQDKDEAEALKMTELRNQAKKELADWYKHYEEQLAKTKKVNRESEKEFVADVNEIEPGMEWERVTKLVDFNPKSNKSGKDLTRMKSIMLQLKQSPVKKAAS